MRFARRVLPGLVLLVATIPLRAADWACQSSPFQANLLELYTSQGCSSCPPADRWLSAVKRRDDLWNAVVPVAWHVTYWDYIGWEDPFGDPGNDRRQRAMAAAAGAQVYTPGLFLNRSEYRTWRRSPPGSVPETSRPVGVLSAGSREGSVSLTFEPAPGITLTAPSVELVFLRSGRHTAVMAGENRGRDLRNDFIAGKPVTIPLLRQGTRWVASLPVTPEPGSEAVALWVLDERGQVVQATGGWLD